MKNALKIDKDFQEKVFASRGVAKVNLQLVPECDDLGIRLMLQLQQGEMDAFTAIFKKYYPMIFQFSCRMLMNAHDAEEITQETFMQVYQAAPRYKPMAKFTTWLYTIAKNLCLNKLKSGKLRWIATKPSSNEELSLEESLPSSDRLPSVEIERKETSEIVMKAVRSLPESLRITIILSRYEEFSNREISVIMKCSEIAVKLRIHRAMKKLAKLLKRHL